MRGEGHVGCNRHKGGEQDRGRGFSGGLIHDGLLSQYLGFYRLSMQENIPPISPLATVVSPGRRTDHPSLWILACVLLGLLQVLWAGYELGAGNQSIQVAFAERLRDASLFRNDLMVNLTLDRYPSLFYQWVAWATRVVPLPQLYLALHLAAAIGVFVATAALCRAAFGGRWAGLVAGLFLLAGHSRALAEEMLYSPGFTHTWAVFPLALGALALLYAGRLWLAFALAGILFNFHALEAGHLGLAMGFWAVCSLRELGWKKVLGLLSVFAACAAPLWVPMLFQRPVFDAEWLRLMRVRSGQHSFPFAWWSAGQADVPRFLVLLALAGVAASLGAPGHAVRKTLLLLAAVAIMFIAGTVLTEFYPLPLAIRAQFFRSSRFVLVLALAFIAWGTARAWALALSRESAVAPWRGWLEAASAVFTAACLAVPSWQVLLPEALVLAVGVALANRRLHWHQATLAGIALLTCAMAWRTIGFVVPGLTSGFAWKALLGWRDFGMVGWGLLGGALALGWLSGRPLARRRDVALALVVGIAACVLGTAVVWTDLRGRPPGDESWVDVQIWAREHTPVDAVFLVPRQPGGFRVRSGRAVVGEWRDGTQLYFSPEYAAPWWERMNAIQPGMRVAPDGKRLLVQGRSLNQLEDKQVIALATQYSAAYAVLSDDPERRLERVYGNERWAIYLPKIAPPPKNQRGAAAEEKRFLREVALPNIEKHRKGDARVQLLDATGRPLYDARWRVVQTRSAFRFGVSLPPFLPPAGDEGVRGDFRSPAATPEQLALVAGVFNFTVLGQSAWWSSIEPKDGERHHDDLDRALAWCREHGIEVELSFLSGFAPSWLRTKPEAEQAPRLLQHAQDLLDRHADRVAWWEVIDQGVFLTRAAEVFRVARAKRADLKLGISDAARFFSTAKSPHREADLLRGLEDLRKLKEQGVAVDFVSLHGRQPWGAWVDPRVVYEVLDAFAKEGVRIHLTAFEAPAEGWIEGLSRQGSWDPKLQAEYGRLFYTTAFSHPAVDAINYAELGPVTRFPGGGLLGPDGQPRLVFDVVKELVTQRWRTTASGIVPLDGVVKFRGFHGDYELEVTLPSGTTVRGAFSLAPGTENSFRFLRDAASGSLKPMEKPSAPAPK